MQLFTWFSCFHWCDYTSSFCRKGKIKPFNKLESDDNLQKVLSTIAKKENICEKDQEVIEKFVCKMYGVGYLKSVDDARLEIFHHKCKPSCTKEQLSIAKKMDACYLPPCSKVIHQKLKRTQYVARLWKSAVVSEPFCPESAEKMGWKLQNDRYERNWFEGDARPKLADVISADEDIEHQEECNINEIEGSFFYYLS